MRAWHLHRLAVSPSSASSSPSSPAGGDSGIVCTADGLGSVAAIPRPSSATYASAELQPCPARGVDGLDVGAVEQAAGTFTLDLTAGSTPVKGLPIQLGQGQQARSVAPTSLELALPRPTPPTGPSVAGLGNAIGGPNAAFPAQPAPLRSAAVQRLVLDQLAQHKSFSPTSLRRAVLADLQVQQQGVVPGEMEKPDGTSFLDITPTSSDRDSCRSMTGRSSRLLFKPPVGLEGGKDW